MAMLGLGFGAGYLIGPLDIPIFAATSQPGESTINVQKQFDLSMQSAAVALAWSRDGSALAAAGNYGSTLTVWDTSGHLINQIARSGDGPALGGALAFVEGTSQLVFPPPAGADHAVAVAVWDVSTGRIIRTENGPQPDDDHATNLAQHFVTSPDQGLLAIATRAGRRQKNLIVYDTRSWKMLHTDQITSGISSISIFAEGRMLGLGATKGGTVEVRDAVSGEIINTIAAYGESEYGSFAITALAGSPSGDLIMTGVGLVVLRGQSGSSPEQLQWAKTLGSDGAVRAYRVHDGAPAGFFSGATAPIREAAWDPKGRFVAFVDSAHGLFLWNPSNGSVTHVELPSSGLSLALSPDGDRIAVSTDHGVRVFSVT
jgi:WD40 repeat protein